MATYGKVIGGGMPIGVLAGKKEYMDALDGGAWNYGDDSFPEVGVTFFAGTFVSHPLALAAAWRVVEHLMGEGPRLQIEMEERVGRFCRTLNEHFEEIGVPIRLPHFSAYAVIEHAPDLKYASLLWYFLREKGVHVWEGRPLYFTTAHTDEDLDNVVQGIHRIRRRNAGRRIPSGIARRSRSRLPSRSHASTARRPPRRSARFSTPCKWATRRTVRSTNPTSSVSTGELDTPALKAALQ